MLSVVELLPSCPDSFSPHDQAVPFFFTARLWVPPPATAITSEKLLIWVAVWLHAWVLLPHVHVVVVVRPSCPESFKPQVHTVPSDFTARLCSQPAAMATTSLRPLTCTGTRLHGTVLDIQSVQVAVVVAPNCPSTFMPQAYTVPSPLRARLWFFPAATATTPVKLLV